MTHGLYCQEKRTTVYPKRYPWLLAGEKTFSWVGAEQMLFPLLEEAFYETSRRSVILNSLDESSFYTRKKSSWKHGYQQDFIYKYISKEPQLVNWDRLTW